MSGELYKLSADAYEKLSRPVDRLAVMPPWVGGAFDELAVGEGRVGALLR
jgi:hypothetical protein